MHQQVTETAAWESNRERGYLDLFLKDQIQVNMHKYILLLRYFTFTLSLILSS